MIINNLADMNNCLQFLVPGYKCGIWNTTDESKYHGENKPILLCNMLIDWNDERSCPSESDIANVNVNSVNAMIETNRKTTRNNASKNDLAILAGFSLQKNSNPDLTLSQYLDDLEKMSESL